MLRCVGGLVERGVEQHLVLNDPVHLDATRRRDNDLGPRIVDAHREFVGGEAAEYDRVHGSETRTGEHRHDGLGDHRHVDDHAVALLDAQFTKDSREERHFIEQLLVRVGRFGVGDGTVVDERQLITTAVLDMPVERVVTGVELAVREPLVKGRQQVAEYDRGFAVPGDGLSGFSPECRGIVDALFPGTCICRHTPPRFTVGCQPLPELSLFLPRPLRAFSPL